MKQGAVIKIVSWVLIALLLIIGIGAIAYFTGGFTSEFKTFYITVDDRDILTSAMDYQLTPGKPMQVDVKYTLSSGDISGYSVKVVPNALPGKDFDFTIDGESYSFQAETDLTAGFDIEYSENSFTIEPKGTLNEVMAAVYPNRELSDFREVGYKNMFLLVVESYNKEATVTLAFFVPENVTGVTVYPDHIYF